ncbi:MAG: glycosyltransferase [Pseudomonadota bacterium]
MTKTVDLSVIVTVHAETIVAGPTMRAAERAVAEAAAAGYGVEALIAYDHPTPAARAFFEQVVFDGWRRVDVDGGDVGATRNRVVAEVARGRALAFLDADDLFSPGWLAGAMDRLTAAEAEGRRAIVHPELNWLFDGAGSVYWNPDQADPLFAPQFFYVSNYYDSLCLAPREAHLEHPYVTRDIARGLSFQDWQFAVETMAAGWEHVSAPDTVIFKRRRDSSLVTESRGRQAIVRQLEPLRIDRIATLGRDVARREDTAPPPLETSLTALSALHDRARQETPHWGAVFQARIARAEAKRDAALAEMSDPPSAGSDADYAAMAQVFDPAFYLAANPDVAELEGVDPLRHYLRSGHREDREPSPLLGTLALAERQAEAGAPPDTARAVLDWLAKPAEARAVALPFTRALDMAPLIGLSPEALERHWAARMVDLRARLMFGALGREVARTAEIEPLVTQSWPEALQMKLPALHSEMLVKRQSVMAALQAAADGRTARAVILVNRPRFGGARRMEGQIAQALAARFGAGEVLVISTDQPGEMPAGKFPEGVRHVDLATLARDVRPHIRLRLMVLFLRSLAPEVVFNVNSRRFWDAMEPYGQALAASTALVGCFLCNEQTTLGQWTGYPLRRFYRHFEVLAAVCTDSEALAAVLREDYVLPPGEAARIHALAAPVRSDITPVPAPRHGWLRAPARQVFWAGRMDPQKRVPLAFEVARLMPEVTFRFWGAPVSGSDAGWPALPANVVLEGVYGDVTELPLSECDAWLYTSAWDGVPQMLLEVAMAGLPVVASDVGGVREALCPDGATAAERLLGPEATAADYATALTALFAAQKPARAAALARRARLAELRTEAAYAVAVGEVLDGIAARTAAQDTHDARETQDAHG